MAIRVFGSYADILRRPGAVPFVIAGWLGRIWRSTANIGTILLIVGYSHSYALSGAVAASIVVGVGVSAPLWSRAIDSRGQLAVLPVGLIGSLITAIALAAVVIAGLPVWLWFVCAFLLGATSLDTGTLVRARWTGILDSPQQRHTALSLESVLDELAFVIGPPLVTVLATVAGPLYGFAAGLAIALVGGFSLVRQKSTAPLPAKVTDVRPARTGLLPNGVLGVIPLYIGVGVVFGAIDLTAVSVGRGVDKPWLAGILLSSFALGSVVGGFLFGPLTARWAARNRVLLAALAYGAIVPLLLLVHDPFVLIAVVFAAGFVSSPVLISGTTLIESRTERHRLTEALTWPSISLAIGVTAGATIAGFVIDGNGPFSGFVVTSSGALLVGVYGILAALVRIRRRAALPA
ncbi:MFS transporter [soil metagenome]